MTTSAYMPDVRVEVAWNAGYRTPAADRVWTDISDYVELDAGISITYGRQDETDQADANQLSLVLDNKDARFTWGNAASPYYPNLKIGRPIRVIVDTPDNPGEVRFTGFINGWPVEWPMGGDEYAMAAITASSRLSRLGMDAAVRSAVEEATLAAEPLAYYTMGEPAESTQANDTSGNIVTPLVAGPRDGGFTPVVFGNAVGPESDGLTAVELAAGLSAQALRTATAPWPAPLTTLSLSVFVNCPVLPTGTGAVVQVDGFELGFSGSGTAFAGINTGPGILGTTAVGDARLHHLALTYDGATMRLYVDGALENSGPIGLPGAGSSWIHVLNGGLTGSDPLVVAHAAVLDTVLTAAQIADIADSGLQGHAGEDAAERIQRYARWAAIPDDEVVTTPSSITLSAAESSGKQVLDLMREVETAEAGVLHDDRLGRLVLEPRGARYGAASVLTLDCASERVGVDYAPRVGREGMYNLGSATNADGSVTATYANQASREEYGDVTYQVETTAADPDEPLNLIAWVVDANAEPRPRAGSVTVNLLPYITDTTDDTGTLLALDIGSKVTVANAPSQAPGGATVDYFTEGYRETFGRASWSLSLNLSPSSPTDDVLILDDPDDGLLDVNILAL